LGTKRPVHGDDFGSSTPLIRDVSWINRWGVCTRGYKLEPAPPGASHGHRLRAKRPFRLTDADGENWKTYKPLEENPDLFLRFARLSRKPGSPQRALDWCEQYGVLGLAGDYHWGWTGENNAHQAYESLGAFDAEVERAAGVLSLYEAALNRDEEAAEYYTFEKYSQISAEVYGANLGRGWDQSLVRETVETWAKGDCLVYALEATTFVVESTVRQSCYPTLRSEGNRHPSDVIGSWGFKNLRGAMYLQMYWLMAAGGNVARCKWCGGVIPLSSNSPGETKSRRKPRQDKKFCDHVCRQRHHYHNKTKQRRNEESHERQRAQG
jgi:hypothetical protein